MICPLNSFSSKPAITTRNGAVYINTKLPIPALRVTDAFMETAKQTAYCLHSSTIHRTRMVYSHNFLKVLSTHLGTTPRICRKLQYL